MLLIATIKRVAVAEVKPGIGIASGQKVASAKARSAALAPGTPNFNHTSDSFIFSPAISGTGTIDVLAGMAVFDGNDSGFTGTTNISGGVLQVGDTSHASVVLGGTTNFTGGLLSGFGTVHGAVVNNGGTLAPSNGVTAGTLTINGNYTQGGGGMLSILLTPSTASRLAVTGVACLDGTLLLSGSFVRGQSDTILTAGSVGGTFSSVSGPTLGNAIFKAPMAATTS